MTDEATEAMDALAEAADAPIFTVVDRSSAIAFAAARVRENSKAYPSIIWLSADSLKGDHSRYRLLRQEEVEGVLQAILMREKSLASKFAIMRKAEALDYARSQGWI